MHEQVKYTCEMLAYGSFIIFRKRCFFYFKALVRTKMNPHILLPRTIFYTFRNSLNNNQYFTLAHTFHTISLFLQKIIIFCVSQLASLISIHFRRSEASRALCALSVSLWFQFQGMSLTFQIKEGTQKSHQMRFFCSQKKKTEKS